MNLNEASLNALFIARVREENGADVKLGDIFKHMAGEVVEASDARACWECNGRISQELKSAYAEELADVLICVLIAAKRDEIDIESAVNLKMQKNAQRAALEGDKL
jgi:NTP pyrophosphatase (non-canonical NTP hydrolase)